MTAIQSPMQSWLRRVACEELKRTTDVELLRAFATEHDAQAFRTLVDRHGPLVLDVCRAWLPHDLAEDAYQATFLALSRQAHSIREGRSLGSWLYGVALRIARKARFSNERRKHIESQANASGTCESDDVSWREVRAILHEELDRLPSHLRQPLVLVYLQGKTQEEVATELRCSKSTVKRRLDEGQQRLRWRLVRRGLGSLAVWVGARPALARPPVNWADQATRIALGYANATPRIAQLASSASTISWWGILASLSALALLMATVAGSMSTAAIPIHHGQASQVQAPKTSPSTRIVVPMGMVREDGRVHSILASIEPATGKFTTMLEKNEGLAPRVSPDGTTAIFVRDNAIWNCDTAGSNNPGQLAHLGSHYQGAVWSHDGKHMFATRLISKLNNEVWNHDIIRFTARGEQETKMSTPAGDALMDVSADGKFYLTRHRVITRLNTSECRLIPVAGGEPKVLSEPGGFNEPSRFSRDGKRVAYVRNKAKEGFSVRMADLDGGSRQTLFQEMGVFIEGCCWSPDGKQVAITAADLGPQGQIPFGQDGNWRLLLVDVATLEVRTVPIAAQVRYLRFPDWYTEPK